MVKSVYLETYGCSANQNNTEIMSGLLVKAGFKLEKTPENADFIIINSCVVKGPTENKIYSRINELSNLGKRIIVAGCMPDCRKAELRKLSVGLLGVKSITKIVEMLESNQSEVFNDKEVKLSLSKLSQNQFISITQISEGCLGNCAYCATKLSKGQLLSFPEQEILENIENDLNHGAREIWLTSQDNAIYGMDIGKQQLPELISKILALPYEFMLRIGMLNPSATLKIKAQLIPILNSGKVFKFMHIPVQSGSNKILKLMNRGYTKEEFIELIKYFREKAPNLTLATDIIVGFPGESEQDFEETLELIREIKPDFVNINRFWPMKGTKAAKLKKVAPEIVKQRIISLAALCKSQLDNKSWIGWKGKCLLNLKNKKGFFARNQSYKRILVENANDSMLGKFVDIQVTRTLKNYLAGLYI